MSEQPFSQGTALAAGALLVIPAARMSGRLPAILVANGTDPALAGSFTAVAQMVWLSRQQVFVLGVARLVRPKGGPALLTRRRVP